MLLVDRPVNANIYTADMCRVGSRLAGCPPSPATADHV
jgi:hypothetical protein